MEQKKGNQVTRTNKKNDICLSVIFSCYDPSLFLDGILGTTQVS